MNDDIKVAVCGMGYWGKNLVRVFNELGALAMVCDVHESAQKTCEEKYPRAKFQREYQLVIDDPSITAIAIATPAALHHEMAKKALLAGKDVFVEKPLAIELDHGEELVDLAEKSGRVLMVGHILRYHPAVIKLRELVSNGVLGKIQYLYSNRLNIGKIRTEENILWSFAPHDISVVLGLLNEMPVRVFARGGEYLSQNVSDVTLSHFDFPSGVQAHVFVSWLHPFKEQRLVVVGSDKMAVFDDNCATKLVLYSHKVQWKDRVPTAVKADAEPIALDTAEPLKSECQHFLDCVKSRSTPRTDGKEALRVLRVLDACQSSLRQKGSLVEVASSAGREKTAPFFIHNLAVVEDGAKIGAGTKIWHFAHVMKGAEIGERCVLGQNVNVDGGVIIGNNVKIQNNVSLYTGVVVEDDVFLGPSSVFTNVTNPRSQVNRHSLYERTVIRCGATVGANATIVCGATIGRYAFVGAGAVVTKTIPDYALVVGNPARQIGWMSRHGHKLSTSDESGIMVCPETGYRYQEIRPGEVKCLDLPEECPLPLELTKGSKPYNEFKKKD